MQVHERLSINELLARFPAIAPVLARMGLDLCCGGFDSIEDAARNAGVEVDDLMRALEAALEAP